VQSASAVLHLHVLQLVSTFKLCQLVRLGPELQSSRRLSAPLTTHCLHSDVAMYDDMFDVSDTEEQRAHSASTPALSRTKLESPGGDMSMKRKASFPAEPSGSEGSTKKLRVSGML